MNDGKQMTLSDPPRQMMGFRNQRSLYLDGLRGIAALYVVLHHAFIEQPLAADQRFAHAIAPLFEFGRSAVDIFIVLSGYCLMIPVAKSSGNRLRSTGEFFQRRAWRILPPYYAAVALSLLCIEFVPGMDSRMGAHWDISLPAFSRDVLLSHLFLVQDFSFRWAYKINHALWSIAVECQIYLLFPLILLPVLRRGGIAALSMLMFGSGIFCFYAFPSLRGARPWYVGLFGLGMISAIISTASGDKLSRFRQRMAWGWLTILLFIMAASTALFRTSLKRHEWVADDAVGLMSFSLITFCGVRSRGGGKPGLVLQLLESKPAVWLGIISYSLYLVHTPLIAALNLFLQRQDIAPGYRLLLMTTIGAAVSVLAGWLFHLCVEQWFIPKGDPRRISVTLAPVIAAADVAINDCRHKLYRADEIIR